MKLLLIEDDATFFSTLSRMLRRRYSNLVIKHAENAHAAIEHLRNSAVDVPFDAVISDYNLHGGTTGAHALGWIREHMSYLETRFVFFSGNDLARRHGVPFVSKFDLLGLLPVVDQMVSA